MDHILHERHKRFEVAIPLGSFALHIANRMEQYTGGVFTASYEEAGDASLC